MTQTFANLIPDARAFFTDLAANNTKDWFETHKTRHAERVRKPAEALAAVLAADFSRLTGRELSHKVYRIHRDVRFSKDKSPYNTHLHILWSFAPQDRPGLFLAIDPAGVTFATGVMAFTPGGLDWARNAIADDPSGWLSALDRVRAAGGNLADWGEPPLKRVPKPWNDDHPAGDLLRRKSLIVSLPLGEGAGDPVPLLRNAAERLMPFWNCFDAGATA